MDRIIEDIELDRDGRAYDLEVHYRRSPFGTIVIDWVYLGVELFPLTEEELADLRETLKEPL